MAANPNRGDVEIELRGKKYVMRPTYDAIMEIEQTTGVSILEISRRCIAADYGMGDARAIVTAGLKAAGEPATIKAVGEMLFDTGLLSVAGPLVSFCANAISGGETGEPGEEGAKAEGKTESLTESSAPSPMPLLDGPQ